MLKSFLTDYFSKELICNQPKILSIINIIIIKHLFKGMCEYLDNKNTLNNDFSIENSSVSVHIKMKIFRNFEVT